MIQEIPVERFLDEPYGKGLNVVLLHLRDDLYLDALDAFKTARPRMYGIKLWTCHVKTEDDVAMVQACRFPQYRFLLNGVERSSYVGVLGERDLLDKIYAIEGS